VFCATQSSSRTPGAALEPPAKLVGGIAEMRRYLKKWVLEAGRFVSHPWAGGVQGQE